MPRTPEEYMEAQLDLPIGYNMNLEKTVSLREVIQGGEKFVYAPFSNLPLEQKAEITKERVKASDKEDLYISRGYNIDKQQRIEELSKLSESGKSLIEIEGIVIGLVLKDKEKFIKYCATGASD